MFLSQCQAYYLFCKSNPTTPISFSTFQRLRPKYVLKHSRFFHFTCQYPYCINVEILLESINRSKFADQLKKQTKLYTVYQVCDLVMCEKETVQFFHDSTCINGNCKYCNNTEQKLLTHYKDIMLETQGVIKWQSWVTKKVEVTVRKDGKFMKELKTRFVLTDNRGDIKDVITALIKAIDNPARGTTLRQNIHCANW